MFRYNKTLVFAVLIGLVVAIVFPFYYYNNYALNFQKIGIVETIEVIDLKEEKKYSFHLEGNDKDYVFLTEKSSEILFEDGDKIKLLWNKKSNKKSIESQFVVEVEVIEKKERFTKEEKEKHLISMVEDNFFTNENIKDSKSSIVLENLEFEHISFNEIKLNVEEEKHIVLIMEKGEAELLSNNASTYKFKRIKGEWFLEDLEEVSNN